MQKLAGIIKEAAFNDGGEPMMTHNQFRDYSEPSDEEFDDYPYPNDNDEINISREFINKMKKNLFKRIYACCIDKTSTSWSFDGTAFFYQIR